MLPDALVAKYGWTVTARSGRGMHILCPHPAHADSTGDCSVREGRTQTLLYCHCLERGSWLTWVKECGIDPHDLFADGERLQSSDLYRGIRTATEYLAARGHSPAALHAFGITTSRQNNAVLIPMHGDIVKARFITPDKAARFRYLPSKGDTTNWPFVYNAACLDDDDPSAVFLVEGPLDVVTLHEAGLRAIAPYDGCSTWTKDTARLRDALKGRPLLLLFDRDEAGETQARLACDAYRADGIDARIVALRGANLPPGSDVTNLWVYTGCDPDRFKQELRALVTAPSAEPSADAVSLSETAVEPVAPTVTPPTGVPVPPPASTLEVLPLPDDPWPQPLDLDALPWNPLTVACRALADYSEADAAALFLQGLVLYGVTLGRTPHRDVGGVTHHANENLLLVGDTAEGRKGSSLAPVRTLFRYVDETLRTGSGLSTGEGLLHFVRDPTLGQNKKGEPIVLDDGVSDKRFLDVETEFGGLIKVMERQGNKLTPVLRDLWDSLPVVSSLSKGGSVIASKPHVSVIAHVTPDELRTLSATEFTNGFLNRFLVAAVRRARVLPLPPAIPESFYQQHATAIRQMLDVARNVGAIAHTPAWEQRWCDTYVALGADTAFSTRRAHAHVLRLSMLLALLEGSATMDVEHLDGALTIWDFVRASAVALLSNRAFGAYAGDERALQRHRDRLVEELTLHRSDGLMLLSEVTEFVRNNYPAMAIVEPLIRAGTLDLVQLPPTGKRGRPARGVRLHQNGTQP